MLRDMESRTRCAWCGQDALSQAYHDEEWGVPLYDDRRLFEFLILETMQAGLSWLTVLRKREHFRGAFANFDPEQVAHFDEAKMAALLADPGIIRNRLKIAAAVRNAQAFLRLTEQVGSFSSYMWGFTDGRPIVNHWQRAQDVPAHTDLSDRLSRDLQKRGFAFVGSTICYAHLQATGVVMDHLTTCFRHHQLSGEQ